MAYPPSPVAADKANATVTLDDHAPHHDALATAINDTVTELGTNPSGTDPDVTTRLATLDTTVGAKQPLDSDLTAIAALSTTSYGRAFLALVDAAAARTALALGTAALAASGDFDAAGLAAAAQAASQPLDSDLTAIAALTTTSFGRALLALADAAAGRTALGLGTAATQASTAFDAAGAASAAQAASQPLDSDLTAIAALTTTSFGRAFLALADAAATRTALALVIGTDVQAFDTDLAAIAALVSAANKIAYATGAGTWALADFTAAGRAIVDDADAAAQRTTLGLGTAAVVDTGTSGANVPTVTQADARYAPITPVVGVALGTTGTVNLDFAALDGTYQDVALSGNITFTTSNRVAGRTVTIRITAASLRTFTFPAWVFLGSTPVQIAAGKTGVLTLTSFGTTDANVVAAWAVSA